VEGGQIDKAHATTESSAPQPDLERGKAMVGNFFSDA
jgi:hypothetical protein